MTLYILAIKNRITYDISQATSKWEEWLKRQIPTIDAIEWNFIDVDLPLDWEDYKLASYKTNGKTWWGLAGIKDQLRRTGKIYQYKYHVIAFLYDLPADWDFQNRPLGAWTYPSDLNGAAFFETPVMQSWGQDNLERIETHEIIHCFHRLCWWKGKPTNDTMDLYDKEYEIEAPDGNRARNLAVLRPVASTFLSLPISIALEVIKQKVLALLSLIQNMDKVTQWAEAAKIREGWILPGAPGYPNGSASYRNNNPGNIRYGTYAASLGAYSQSANGFAIFRSYDDGFKALCQFFRDAAHRQLKPYHIWNPNIEYHKVLMPEGKPGDELPDLTLTDFYQIYAPSSDNNDPNSYALFVAGKLKVAPQIKIKDLV